MIFAALCGARACLDYSSAAAEVRGKSTGPRDGVGQGQLRTLDERGKLSGFCPLKHTDVKAEISGFLARVTVTQEFQNPTAETIEAVYLFPLPQRSAVDRLTMDVGGQIIRGEIKRRADAQQIFAKARAEGRVAALLDQERPNLFTQTVTNIVPGATINVTLSYVETLSYENGVYEFIFPMVVGPRYIPGELKSGAAPTDKNQEEIPTGTDQVPDAARLIPPYMPDGMRPGHDISIEVAVDSGVPLEQISSELHEIEVERDGQHQAVVKLKDQAVIPDRDFSLRYGVAGGQIADGVLTHRDERGGYFSLILQPPNHVVAEDVMPKELVFVLDTSGSMFGLPLETAKQVMRLALDGLYESDTFNLITFAGDTHILFDKPAPATKANLRKATQFLEGNRGGGGTEMMKAIRAALADTDTQDHIRIVCFLTDGEVGNDMAIIDEVQRHPNARVFSFGIGNSVNRFLLDKMAESGRGEAEYVFLNRGREKDSETAAASAKRFYERVRSPLLTDITVDWNGLPVADVYPKRLPDLFSAKPLTITGRYTAGGRGMVRLRGKVAGSDFLREIFLDLPEVESRHDALASVWARQRIDELMARDFSGLQSGNARPEVEEAITQLGLEYRLMTQFTSFVAIGDVVTASGNSPQRISVPVATPYGTTITGASGVTETVEISSSASLVNTSDTTLAATIEQRGLDDLPLNMRQPTEAVKLAVGAAPT
jgi:Ca-activated chloride channel family protein